MATSWAQSIFTARHLRLSPSSRRAITDHYMVHWSWHEQAFPYQFSTSSRRSSISLSSILQLHLWLKTSQGVRARNLFQASSMHIPAKQFLSLRALGAPAAVVSLAIQGIFCGSRQIVCCIFLSLTHVSFWLGCNWSSYFYCYIPIYCRHFDALGS